MVGPVMPNRALSMIKQDETKEVWIRILGLILTILGNPYSASSTQPSVAWFLGSTDANTQRFDFQGKPAHHRRGNGGVLNGESQSPGNSGLSSFAFFSHFHAQRRKRVNAAEVVVRVACGKSSEGLDGDSSIV